jgi:hypothetical protein
MTEYFLQWHALIFVERGQLDDAAQSLLEACQELRTNPLERPRWLASAVATAARIQLRREPASLTPALAAGAILDLLDRETAKLDPVHSQKRQQDWSFPRSLSWGRPWTFCNEMLALPRLMKSFLAELSSLHDEPTLASLFEQGKAQGVEPFVQSYFRDFVREGP